ncbi:hypothetical protein K493DRAFT_318104 [Basidiobolus meristosporus CBS 931.73]|uniref:EF-hand domain-containing protein n=1 Tax=Basidiobolus meristosporus CBS 931.73 TaxID=1314790 RepID=A0A1Y1XY21_9FUNG|nr:hypothetical protein K493DRAFT_318104 [Basidiobolus meristosporus CBS 931.73]|eukprot:ORX90254.1 hypothetical protein K493DRAFT_318104 [Basidiobolus meristosporus CBS 931.73]
MSLTSPIRTPKSSKMLSSSLPQVDEVSDRFIQSPNRDEINRASYSPRYNDILKQKLASSNSPEKLSKAGSPYKPANSPRSPAPISPICARKSPKSFIFDSDVVGSPSSPLTRIRSPVEVYSPTRSTRLKFEALSPISDESAEYPPEEEDSFFLSPQKPKKLIFQEAEDNDIAASATALKKTSSRKIEGSERSVPAQVAPRSIPQFYFPRGNPELISTYHNQITCNLEKLKSIFDQQGSLTDETFVPVTEAFLLPRYFTFALFRKLEVILDCENSINYNQLMRGWRLIQKEAKDEASLGFYLLKQDDSNYLVPEDFYVVLEDIICGHPELEFLNGNTTFQDRYAETVVSRLFYDHNRSWTGKLRFEEFKRGKIMETIHSIENGIDSDESKTCFSYKDFYVIYCKFWELDEDHDLEINEDQLACYMEGSLTDKIIRRVIDGYGKISDLPLADYPEPKMSYRDFVWFILSEVNKSTPTAIEYWFRCLDIDGDGLLTVFELEYFYEEQLSRMEYAGVEYVSLDDCFCQMSDLVNPKKEGVITLMDLKNCPEANVFFDMFFNLSRFIDYESRPRHLRRKRRMGLFEETVSPWDEYVEVEYDRLVYGAEDDCEEEYTQEDNYNFLEEESDDTTQFAQTLRHAQDVVSSY